MVKNLSVKIFIGSVFSELFKSKIILCACMNALTYESAHRELIVGGIKQGLNMREIHKYMPKSVSQHI